MQHFKQLAYISIFNSWNSLLQPHGVSSLKTKPLHLTLPWTNIPVCQQNSTRTSSLCSVLNQSWGPWDFSLAFSVQAVRSKSAWQDCFCLNTTIPVPPSPCEEVVWTVLAKLLTQLRNAVSLFEETNWYLWNWEQTQYNLLLNVKFSV